MTKSDKEELATILDGRMREVSTMIGGLEKAFQDFKEYLRSLMDSQQKDIANLRESTIDLYDKRNAVMEKLAEMDKKVTELETELDHVKEGLAKNVDSKRFNITTWFTGIGLVVMIILYVLDKAVSK